MDLDTWLFFKINGLAGKWEALDWMMLNLSRGPSLFTIVLLLSVFWVWRRGREAFYGMPVLAGLIGVADFWGGQVKMLVARPRPCQVFQHIYELTGCGGTFSLPSNHAVNSAAAAAFLATLYPTTGWIAWPIVAFVGISRVYVGSHFVTDVVSGWALGGMLGMATAFILSRWVPFDKVAWTSRSAHRAE